MSVHRLMIWTGSDTAIIAESLREAGITVALVCTERVYVEGDGQTPEGAAWNVLVDLVREFGTDFGLRPKPTG